MLAAGEAFLTHRWFDRLFVATTLGLATLSRVTTFTQPLLEAHGFRQTQTAYTALIFRDEGISLLHSRLPVLGPPFEVPFELPLFQALGSVVMRAGVDPDLAMRTTGFTWFLVTGVLLFGFVRRFAGRLAAGTTLVVFLFGPFGIVWSRASLMEYMATALGVAFVWAGAEWREHPRGWLAAVATACGAIACLVKLTTGLVFLLPLIMYRGAHDATGLRGWLAARAKLPFGVMLVAPLVAALAWTTYADSIKARNPATQWLTSRELRDWNFGPIHQRLDPSEWASIGQRVIDQQFGAWIVEKSVDKVVSRPLGQWLVLITIAVIVATAVFAVWGTRNRALWIGWMLAGVMAVLVFFNLHYVHDYYQAAIHPITASVVGLATASAVRVLRVRPAFALIGAACITATWLGFAFTGPDRSWKRAYEKISSSDGTLEGARRLASLTTPNDLIVTLGFTWSPALLYYARRRGTMLGSFNATPAELTSLLTGHDFLVSANPTTDPIGILGHWRWFTPVAPGMYRMGETLRSIAPAPAAGTFDVGAIERARKTAFATYSGPLVDCRTGIRIPRVAGDIWLRPARSTPGAARIEIDGIPAPFPGRAAIRLRESSTGSILRCTGVDELRLDALYATHGRSAP